MYITGSGEKQQANRDYWTNEKFLVPLSVKKLRFNTPQLASLFVTRINLREKEIIIIKISAFAFINWGRNEYTFVYLELEITSN